MMAERIEVVRAARDVWRVVLAGSTIESFERKYQAEHFQQLMRPYTADMLEIEDIDRTRDRSVRLDQDPRAARRAELVVRTNEAHLRAKFDAVARKG